MGIDIKGKMGALLGAIWIYDYRHAPIQGAWVKKRMPPMPLTDAAIKGLRPQEKSYKVLGGNGLYIEVLKTVTKVWRFKYRFGGKEKRLIIGEYPTVSLKSARLLLIEAKQHLTRGIDPSANKKAEREQTDVRTFASVGDEWMLRQAPKWSEHYKDALDARLRRFVYPQIGMLDIKDIQPKTVLDFVRRIEGEGKTNTAYRVLGVCSLIFRYGVACDTARLIRAGI